jgi:alpha-1,3/alpha-1,6-mannosyltransferase
LEDREELEEYISFPDYLRDILGTFKEPSNPNRKTNMFISLNRYERKKRIELALQALALLKADNNKGCRLLLVIAGGYDERVQENVQYLHELQATADSLGLIWCFPSTPHIFSLTTDNTTEKRCGPNVDVIFRVSISSAEREALLLNSCALLYTPENEHFGIVPLEAMRSGTPVIAVNSGGPVETILNGKTGFLCDQTPESFSDAMKHLMGVGNSRGGKYLFRSSASIEMGSTGRKHVLNNFTAQIMRDKLQKTIQEIVGQSNPIKKHQVVYGNKCLRALLSIVFLLFFFSLFILRLLCQSTNI